MTALLLRFLLGMAIFLPLQRLLPLRPPAPVLREGWATDALNYLANGVLALVAFRAWQALVPDALGWARPYALPLSLHRQPLVVQVAALLLTESFVYYWGHRALHRWPALWRFHAIHHSTQHLDWLGGWRGHVFETFYFTAFLSVAMLLLNVSVPTALAFTVYRFLEGQIEHSNLRLPLGPLKWVFPSPWFHHWHHARDREAWDKNFSSYPIWDVVFGTAFMPAGRLPSGFGLPEPIPTDYPRQVLYPFGWEPAVAAVERWLAGVPPFRGRLSVPAGRPPS